MEEDPTGFSKAFTSHYPGDTNTEFFFHKVELDDKIILNVQINGAMDTTFDIPISPKASINFNSSLENTDDDSGVEPIMLVGNYKNLKVQVVATQIGKLILHSTHPKNIILSIGSKWFGKGDETDDDDFNRLMFVLDKVKELIQ